MSTGMYRKHQKTLAKRANYGFGPRTYALCSSRSNGANSSNSCIGRSKSLTGSVVLRATYPMHLRDIRIYFYVIDVNYVRVRARVLIL